MTTESDDDHGERRHAVRAQPMRVCLHRSGATFGIRAGRQLRFVRCSRRWVDTTVESLIRPVRWFARCVGIAASAAMVVAGV